MIEAGVIAQGFPAQIVFYCYILNGYANNMNRSVLYYYHNSPRNASIFSSSVTFAIQLLDSWSVVQNKVNFTTLIKGIHCSSYGGLIWENVIIFWKQAEFSAATNT